MRQKNKKDTLIFPKTPKGVKEEAHYFIIDGLCITKILITKELVWYFKWDRYSTTYNEMWSIPRVTFDVI